MLDTSLLLDDIEFVAFDLETTGLSAHECQIVEFGAVRFRLDGKILACFEQLVDPGCPIPRAASRIHGITDSMVSGMPTVAETLPMFLEFVGNGSPVGLAHNARFDVSFLEAATERGPGQRLAGPVVDTLRLARRTVQGMYNYRLESLARALQVADAEDHRALSDARLVMGLFSRITQLHRDLTTLKQLFAFAPPLPTDQPTRRRPSHVNHRHLAQAIEQQRTVVMVYEGGTKGLSDRRVTPQGLVTVSGRRCLVAYCHADKMEKTFRLDRIRELRIELD